jgi:hypothetical protein
MRDRRILTLDEERIKRRARELQQKVQATLKN